MCDSCCAVRVCDSCDVRVCDLCCVRVCDSVAVTNRVAMPTRFVTRVASRVPVTNRIATDWRCTSVCDLLCPLVFVIRGVSKCL